MMTTFWNARYTTDEYVYGTLPNAFLSEQLEQPATGKILFPAEGEGRHHHEQHRSHVATLAAPARSRVQQQPPHDQALERGADVHPAIRRIQLGQSLRAPPPVDHHREQHGQRQEKPRQRLSPTRQALGSCLRRHSLIGHHLSHFSSPKYARKQVRTFR